MADNGISTLSTKELRQIAKLELASADRLAVSNPRAYYDITQLPTQYSDNDIIDNPNPDGLVVGRPWISISYSIVPNSTSVNEGNTITYTITTVGVANSTTLYWTNSGTTVGTDFTGGANSGSFTINSNTATITRQLRNDATTEGSETVILKIRTGSISGPIVATSATVTVADTSTTPVVPTYEVAPDVSSMNEGDSAIFTITTALVSDGTTLYWGNLSDNLTNSPTPNRLSPGYTGSVTINSNTATVTITVSADSADQSGVQKLRIGLYTDSGRTNLVATSTPDVTVADTSVFSYFEQQLRGGTYMTFDQTIGSYRVQSVVTNFDGTPTTGSYIKVNGTVLASDWTLSPDGTDNRPNVGFRMTRGHTITIMNPATGTSRSGFPKCYDTYGNSGLGTNIAADIKAAATNDIIIIGTWDATSVNTAFRNALTNYCGDTAYTNTWTSVRTSHMFLGKRNSTP
jgi:hypothetical protein